MRCKINDIEMVMKKPVLKNEHQKMLFELIRTLAPKNQVLVDIISDLLNISTDAAYRRIRSEKTLDLNETIFLCRHFKISMDALADIAGEHNFIRCQYNSLDLSNKKNYLTYLQNLLDNLEEVRATPDGEMICTAVDVPAFNYLAYKELTYFRLYTWSADVYGFTGSFEEFVQQWDCAEAFDYYAKIVKTYQRCPSTEIWTDYTINMALRFLDYHYEMRHFDHQHTPVVLCEQLLDMTDAIHSRAAKGVKGVHGTPLKFYISETDLNNNFVLFKKNGATNCTIKLFTINHFYISDQRFCVETEKWLNTAIQRATLVSGSSEKQRRQFFDRQRQKITALKDKLSNLV